MYSTTSPTQNQFLFQRWGNPSRPTHTHTHTSNIGKTFLQISEQKNKLTEKANKTLGWCCKVCENCVYKLKHSSQQRNKDFYICLSIFWCCASAVVSLGANLSQTISSIPSYKHFLSFIWAAQQQAQTRSSVCSWDCIDSGGKWSVCSSSHDAGCSAGLNSDTSDLSWWADLLGSDPLPGNGCLQVCYIRQWRRSYLTPLVSLISKSHI